MNTFANSKNKVLNFMEAVQEQKVMQEEKHCLFLLILKKIV